MRNGVKVLMSIRCAVCGSKNVVKEFRKEGYDVKKGAIGTVLVGVPGALAGAGGKNVIYYHCADCGQVLNRPMNEGESEQIDRCLRTPDMGVCAIREIKKRYKNIEWEDPDFQGSALGQSTNLEEQIVQCLQLRGVLTSDEIDNYVGTMCYWTIKEMEKTGRVKRIFKEQEIFYQLVTNPEEILETRLSYKAHEEAVELWMQEDNLYCQFLVDADYEIGKKYAFEEIEELVKKALGSKFSNNSSYFLHAFTELLIEQLRFGHVLAPDELVFYDDETVERLTSESLRKAEETQRKNEEETEKLQEKVWNKILEILSKTEKMMTWAEIDRDSEMYLDDDIYPAFVRRVLDLMAEQDVIEKIDENPKKIFYARKGYTEEKQKEKKYHEKYEQQFSILKEKKSVERKIEDARTTIDELEKKFPPSGRKARRIIYIMGILIFGVMGIGMLFTGVSQLPYDEAFGIAFTIVGIIFIVLGLWYISFINKEKKANEEHEYYEKILSEHYQKIREINKIPSFEIWYRSQTQSKVPNVSEEPVATVNISLGINATIADDAGEDEFFKKELLDLGLFTREQLDKMTQEELEDEVIKYLG